MAVIDARKWLPAFLNHLGLTGEGVEVGVSRGDNADNVLSGLPDHSPPVPAWRGRTLHLVDVDLRAARVRFAAGRPGRAEVTFRERPSAVAAAEFADESLDWVYVDADHRYEAVKADVAAWWPKVRPGGLLGGHCYMITDWGGHEFCGVRWAVDRFAADRGLPVYVAPSDPEPSWFVFKCPPARAGEVVVVSGHTDPAKHFVAAVRRNHEGYCARWGYEYRFIDLPRPADRSPVWEKLPAVVRVMGDAPPGKKWVVWVDADAVFTNPARPIHTYAVDRFAFLAAGWYGGNPRLAGQGWHPDCGVMFFRRCANVAERLTRTYAEADAVRWDPPHDDHGLREAFATETGPDALLYVTREFNACPQWSPARGGLDGREFVMHFSYGVGDDRKAAAILDTLSAVADGAVLPPPARGPS